MDLLGNIELAVKALVDAGALGLATYIGQDQTEQVRPNVTIYAQQGQELVHGLGNYRVDVLVQVRSNAADTSQQQHRQRVGQVFNLVHIDDFADQVSANSDVHIFSGGDEASGLGMQNAQETHGVEDDSWLSELRFECAACLRDIA